MNTLEYVSICFSGSTMNIKDSKSHQDNFLNNSIDLIKLVNLFWRKKIQIISITSLFAVFSVFYALSLPDYYKSESILVNAENTNQLSGLQGLSGLASIAGINIQNSRQDKSIVIFETLKSRAFVRHLIKFDNILPSLVAAKEYDSSSQKIIFDSEVYDASNKVWLAKKSNNNKKDSKPSFIEAHAAYLEHVTINQDKFTNLITISVEHISPLFAKEFLDLIIRELNELLRFKDLQDSTNAIDFLTSEIPKSSLVTMKDAINQLVHSRLEMQMMARISSDYALKIIDPAYIPEEKSRPNRASICIMITLAGGLFSVLFVLLRYFISSKRM